MALERYSKEELIDLMTHLLRVYVLNESTPLEPQLAKPSAPEELAKLTFPQLILHLQMSLDLEQLGLLRVDGKEVYITLGEREFRLGGPTPIPMEEVEALRAQAPEAAPVEAPTATSFIEDEIAADEAPRDQAPAKSGGRFDISTFDFGDDHPSPSEEEIAARKAKSASSRPSTRACWWSRWRWWPRRARWWLPLWRGWQ